jgi:pyrroloquinoline quinone biosynthesis protein E
MKATLHPLALIAELTHRCPLHCVYCSNPQELTRRERELSTDVWARVLREAAELGVMQADFTGGEPLARPDIVDIIRAARGAGLYASLITSGVPLDEKRLEEIVNAGLDHVQLSFQGAEKESASEFSGTRTHAAKLRVATWVKRYRVALTLNFVIHRGNLGQLEQMLALVEEIEPQRVEFAHVQYYGWAYVNRARLLPTREQVDHSLEILKKAEDRLRGSIRVEYVVPDYHSRFPKACMGGWGRKVMLISPGGDAMPCHAANVIPGMKFENVQAESLRRIWENSWAFQKFRGEDWMPEPCASCDRRTQDFGGCRCQAFLLAKDAAATDPVCSLSPYRSIVDSILLDAGGESNAEIKTPAPSTKASWSTDWIYRSNP